MKEWWTTGNTKAKRWRIPTLMQKRLDTPQETWKICLQRCQICRQKQKWWWKFCLLTVSVIYKQHYWVIWKNILNIKSKHLGEKYPCDQCDQIFDLKGSLRQHRIYRHGEKTFACTECENTFTYNSSLQRHKKSNHKGWNIAVNIA